MPAVASKVSKTLAQRDVLFTPGGKGEFRKQGKPVLFVRGVASSDEQLQVQQEVIKPIP